MSKLKDRLKLADQALSGGSDVTKSEGLPGATPQPQPSEELSSKASARTAPGGMLAAMGVMRDKDEQLTKLREELECWVGAQPQRRVDTALIDESRFANRDHSHYHGDAWDAFKLELSSSSGNVQAVLLRPKSGGRFEVVFGHRRTRACAELGLPVLAVIATDIDDLQLFGLMERENRAREDLSPYEQGMSYLRALNLKLYPSQRQLANAIDKDVGLVGRYLAIAQLPTPVLDAFPARTQIQKRWGEAISAALQLDPDGVLRRATLLSKLEVKLQPAQVFKQLCAVNESASNSFTVSDSTGSPKAIVTRKGKAGLDVKVVQGTLSEDLLKKVLGVLERAFKS
jgi:ParB family chromosome partitioning protein